MIKILRTNSDDKDFQELVKLLDKELAIRDGNEHSFYAQYNKIDVIKHAVVAFENETSVGCGAFKSFDIGTVEIKRMYVCEDSRSRGIGVEILKELEKWAAEDGFKFAVLETGKKQPEAIRLYQKCGYELIENYGQYKNVENSVCMKKLLRQKRDR